MVENNWNINTLHFDSNLFVCKPSPKFPTTEIDMEIYSLSNQLHPEPKKVKKKFLFLKLFFLPFKLTLLERWKAKGRKSLAYIREWKVKQ